MKFTVPKTADEYFEQTEHAVKHAYAGLDSCWSYVESAQHYAPTPVKEGNMLVLHPPATPEEEGEVTASWKTAGKVL